MLIPLDVAFSAASIFVNIPPVAIGLVESPASEYTDESIFLTAGMSCALGHVAGLPL